MTRLVYKGCMMKWLEDKGLYDDMACRQGVV